MNLLEKWAPVLDLTNAPKIEDAHKRFVVAQLLENQIQDMNKEAAASGGHYRSMLNEDITANVVANHGGDGVGLGQAGTNPQMAGYDTVLINLVRRAMPQLIAFDVCGVQPMTTPVGMIFCMRSRYVNGANSTRHTGKEQNGTEALFNEADSGFSGNKAENTLSNWADNEDLSDEALKNAFGIGEGMSTLAGESLGMDADNAWSQMAFSIEKTTVTAKTRALRAEYTMELAQDLKAVHGLDAETELSNILATEILAEMNREVMRSIYYTAQIGCASGTTAQTGVFDLDLDADGRWSSEKYKGLIMRIEREANAIAQNTRRGRGNFIICSSDVASALNMAGMLDYAPALQTNLSVNEAQATFAGVLNGKYKVYVDPYQSNQQANQFCVVGYKGSNSYDAGIYYAPYVPLQLVRATDPATMAPRIGFKTRYGMTVNPFVLDANDELYGGSADPAKCVNKNMYFRKFIVKHL